jgi:LmbE family N-acetylglucosaminyl deacetylase
MVLGGLLTASYSRAQFPAAPGTGSGLPETVEAIDSARVTTRILYITAHPDDESAAVLTYLARGRHADVALLSLTRGEGGQNALGPEQAPQLGLIRTQELLAATRGYGARLYFTRARDFGFSKTPEETQQIWGDAVTEDMVRVIRWFRPNIVINGWGGVHSGHGHHQASGILTPKAVQLAADNNAFPELIKEDLSPWDGGLAPVQVLDLDRGSDHPAGYLLPVDEVSPLYGKSYRQIGIDAFVNHRTQGISGFINSPFLRRPLALKREDGKPFDPSTLAESLTKLFGEENGTTCQPHPDWCEKLEVVDSDLVQARAAVLKLDFSTATNLLAEAQKALDGVPATDAKSLVGALGDLGERDLLLESERIVKATLLAAGFECRTETERSEIVLGEPFAVTVTYQCRPDVHCPVEGPAKVWVGEKQFASTGGEPGKGLKFTGLLDSTQAKPTALELLQPELPSAAKVVLKDAADPLRVQPITIPVTHVAATSTNVVRESLHIVPAYTIAVEPSQFIEVLNAPQKSFDVLLRVHSYSTKSAKVSAGLDVPDGLKSSAPVDLTFDGVGDRYAKLMVTPPANLVAGNFTVIAYAKCGNEKFSTSLDPLPSMPTLLWSEPAQTIVHAFGINVPANLQVGYISAEGEPIPDALRRLGISVDLLDANALNFGDLSRFDAIVVGVRAYELRPELASANARLLDYVLQGGTLIVQYNRDYIWDRLQPAPYSAKIGSPTPRITDENAAVSFLHPDDPLLNRPNKITPGDFENWIQERGLYFWSDFDSKYTPLLSMHDPSESALNGALVYAHFGKGIYIYTGLAFFRELPEGVPGAYRLFVNLLSASKAR